MLGETDGGQKQVEDKGGTAEGIGEGGKGNSAHDK